MPNQETFSGLGLQLRLRPPRPPRLKANSRYLHSASRGASGVSRRWVSCRGGAKSAAARHGGQRVTGRAATRASHSNKGARPAGHSRSGSISSGG